MLFFQNDTPTQMLSCEFVKLLKHHFYTFKNIIFTEQLRTTASVFIEHNFNIEKPYFYWCQEKKLGKKKKKTPVRGQGQWFCKICLQVWLKNLNNLQNFMPKYQPKQKHLKLSEYFRQYKIRKNHLFRCCVDVATTLLHRRRSTDVFRTS